MQEAPAGQGGYCLQKQVAVDRRHVGTCTATLSSSGVFPLIRRGRFFLALASDMLTSFFFSPWPFLSFFKVALLVPAPRPALMDVQVRGLHTPPSFPKQTTSPGEDV